MNKVTIKGVIVQDYWSDEPHVIQHAGGDPAVRFDSNPYTVFHRTFEIEVELSSLRFDPKDSDTKCKILDVQKVRSLEKDLADNYVEGEKIKEEIRKLTSLEHFDENPVEFQRDPNADLTDY